MHQFEDVSVLVPVAVAQRLRLHPAASLTSEVFGKVRAAMGVSPQWPNERHMPYAGPRRGEATQ